MLKNRKDILIFIMKKYTAMTNGQIGQNFNELSFSAVSKAYQRVSKDIEGNRKMRKDMDKILSILSQFKG